MSECVSAEMRDVLPEYVHGQLDDGRAAEVRAHLAGCADCAAEVELLRAVMSAAPAAPKMNVDRIARALPTPTRHGFLLHRGGGTGSPLTPGVLPAMPRRSRIWSRPVVKIAAAAAIVTAGGLSLLVGRDVLRPDTQVGQMAPTTAFGSRSATAGIGAESSRCSRTRASSQRAESASGCRCELSRNIACRRITGVVR